MSGTLALVGQTAFTTRVLSACLDRGLKPDLVCIGPSVDEDPFTGLTIVNPDLSDWWDDHCFYHHRWREVARELCRAHRIDFQEREYPYEVPESIAWLVVAGLALKVPGRVLEKHRRCLNVHPSLLPAMKGPQPEAHCLLKGLDRSGVSIHSMTSRFDEGPIWFQRAFSIPLTATVSDLERLEGGIAADGLVYLRRDASAFVRPIQSPHLPSYQSFYHPEKTLNLAKLESRDAAFRRLRLRPEGYGFLDIEAGRLFPLIAGTGGATGRKKRPTARCFEGWHAVLRVDHLHRSVVYGGENG